MTNDGYFKINQMRFEGHHLRAGVVDEDLLTTTEDAAIVRGKGQTWNARLVFRLHYSRVPFVLALVEGPQSDGFVSSSGNQKAPVVGEFHWKNIASMTIQNTTAKQLRWLNLPTTCREAIDSEWRGNNRKRPMRGTSSWSHVNNHCGCCCLFVHLTVNNK